MHCGTCRTSVHPKCLRLDPASSVRLQKQGWQCEDCKPCIVCRKTASEVLGSLIICTTCDEGYHIRCVTPTLEHRPNSPNWCCSHCTKGPRATNNNNRSNTASPTESIQGEGIASNSTLASNRKGRGRSRKGLQETVRSRKYSSSSSSSRSRSASRWRKSESEQQKELPSDSEDSDVESKVSMEPLHRPPLPPGVTERSGRAHV